MQKFKEHRFVKIALDLFASTGKWFTSFSALMGLFYTADIIVTKIVMACKGYDKVEQLVGDMQANKKTFWTVLIAVFAACGGSMWWAYWSFNRDSDN